MLVFVLALRCKCTNFPALDASGREFRQTTTKDKTMFLVPFAIKSDVELVFGVDGQSILGANALGFSGG